MHTHSANRENKEEARAFQTTTGACEGAASRSPPGTDQKAPPIWGTRADNHDKKESSEAVTWIEVELHSLAASTGDHTSESQL